MNDQKRALQARGLTVIPVLAVILSLLLVCPMRAYAEDEGPTEPAEQTQPGEGTLVPAAPEGQQNTGGKRSPGITT